MDQIIRMIAKDAPIKASAITGRELVERARLIHKTLPVATAALGRTLLAASMIGEDIKVDGGSVTLRIQGGGPVGIILAVSDAAGNVRGYLQNGAVDLPRKGPGKLDVGAAVGTDGFLTVTKDLCMKDPYVGSVPLVSGEIAEDVTAYFARSEQTPTACALGVLVDTDQSVLAAGGYLIQLLPGARGDLITRLEEGIRKLGPVTPILSDGDGPRELLERALPGFELELLAEKPVTYQCYCSRDRVTRALISMGKNELQSLIEEQGKIELTCQFCDRVYRYDQAQLEELLSSL